MKRFKPLIVQDAMRKYIEDLLKSETYLSEKVPKWTKEISHNIITFLKSCDWPRYKYMVQVVIGEYKGQGFKLS